MSRGCVLILVLQSLWYANHSLLLPCPVALVSVVLCAVWCVIVTYVIYNAAHGVKMHCVTSGMEVGRSCKTEILCRRLEAEFLLTGLKHQLLKICNSSLDTSHSAQNLGFVFDEHLTFSDQITSLSKACYCHIRQLRRIRPYLDSSTACTIVTSIVFSKLD